MRRYKYEIHLIQNNVETWSRAFKVFINFNNRNTNFLPIVLPFFFPPPMPLPALTRRAIFITLQPDSILRNKFKNVSWWLTGRNISCIIIHGNLTESTVWVKSLSDDLDDDEESWQRIFLLSLSNKVVSGRKKTVKSLMRPFLLFSFTAFCFTFSFSYSKCNAMKLMDSSSPFAPVIVDG